MPQNRGDISNSTLYHLRPLNGLCYGARGSNGPIGVSHHQYTFFQLGEPFAKIPLSFCIVLTFNFAFSVSMASGVGLVLSGPLMLSLFCGCHARRPITLTFLLFSFYFFYFFTFVGVMQEDQLLCVSHRLVSS